MIYVPVCVTPHSPPPAPAISVPVYYTHPPCPAHILGFLSLSVTSTHPVQPTSWDFCPCLLHPLTLSSPHPGISVTVCYTHKCLFVHKHLCDDTSLTARCLLKQGHIPPANGGNKACSVTQTHSVLHRNTWIPMAMEVKQYSKS